MCYPITCKDCGKITWDGCGLHIERALMNVSLNERCRYWKNGVHPIEKVVEKNMEDHAKSDKSEDNGLYSSFNKLMEGLANIAKE